MPKGEFDTPGPFNLDGRTIRRNGFRVGMVSDLDEAECAELIDLLNKGTHFDRMLIEIERAGNAVSTEARRA